jgi:hypothetical protein
VLTIRVPGVEWFDDVKQEFIASNEVVLELEHSLVSLSKWESKWETPFLSDAEKTVEQTLSYIQMMSSKEISPDVLNRLTNENFKSINDYINAKMTATWFSDEGANQDGGRNGEVVTAELIYYWMVALNIPFECEEWHLTRLFTLIKVTNKKNTPGQKMSRKDIMARNRALNAKRLAEYGTTG